MRAVANAIPEPAGDTQCQVSRVSIFADPTNLCYPKAHGFFVPFCKYRTSGFGICGFGQGQEWAVSKLGARCLLEPGIPSRLQGMQAFFERIQSHPPCRKSFQTLTANASYSIIRLRCWGFTPVNPRMVFLHLRPDLVCRQVSVASARATAGIGHLLASFFLIFFLFPFPMW